jgi:hypothetical protein
MLSCFQDLSKTQKIVSACKEIQHKWGISYRTNFCGKTRKTKPFTEELLTEKFTIILMFLIILGEMMVQFFTESTI